MIAILLAIACHGQTPVELEAGPPGEPSGGTTPPPPPGGVVEGVASWSSPSCGERTYERVLHMRPDYTFSAEDRVSPCPEGAQCVWSGIATWSGTWSPSPDPRGVYLTETEAQHGDMGQPRPKLLTYGADGRLVEDGTSCAYDKVTEATAPQK